MTRVEVLEVLTRFDAAWPRLALTAPQVEEWVIALTPVDCAFGEAAANALISESQYAPSIAQFKSRARDFARHNGLRPLRNELDAPTPNVDNAKRWIRQLRTQLVNERVVPTSGHNATMTVTEPETQAPDAPEPDEDTPETETENS